MPFTYSVGRVWLTFLITLVVTIDQLWAGHPWVALVVWMFGWPTLLWLCDKRWPDPYNSRRDD